MAQVTEIRLVDDLDKGPAEETVSFGLDGKQYTIDLSGHNATVLRENLADFIAVARLDVSKGPRAARQVRARTATDRANLAEIRSWARENGHQVSDRGRIAKPVVEAYQAAH